MNFRENKIELWIGVLFVVLVVGLFKLLGDSPEAPTIRAQDVTYEMPRPKGELVSEFGLGDREIDRQYVNPFEKKKAEEEAARKAAAAKTAAIVAKAGTPTAAGTAQQNVRRPMMFVNVVDANHKGLSADNDQAHANDRAPEQAAPPVTRAAAGDADPKEDPKLSPDQWRALMSAQPTKENMKKLVEAYQKHDVDDATFYQIVEDLIESKKADKQEIAFEGLNMVPTAKSFAFVATISKDNKSLTTPAEKKLASDYLGSFSAASRRGALFAAIQSSDKIVSLQAANVVLQGLQDFRRNGGTPPQDEGRGRTTTLSTSGGWERFATVLKRWATSGDSELVGQANQILPYLSSIASA